MALSLADIKRAKVQNFRDVADALDGMATANQDMKRGVERLPIMGDGWKGVSGDAAHHDINAHGKYLDGHAQAQQGAAGKIRAAADEFEGVQQLLKKIENDAANGKFTINYDTCQVTPPNGKYDKSELDYLTNTLRQIQAAGDRANTDLEAAVKAAKEPPNSSGPAGALPITPNSSIKPGGIVDEIQRRAAGDPSGDPGATKAAGAAGVDTPGNFYKEWYPKAVDVGDKPVDPSKLGAVGSVPGVVDPRDKTPQPLAPRLADKDVPMFKEATRQQLRSQGVPADQIEQKVNDAVARAQTPHFLPDAPSASPTDPKYIDRDFGDQFNRFTNEISVGGDKAANAMLQEGKELTGLAGPGAPGVAEAWKDLAVDTGKGLYEYTTATPQERLEMLGNEAQRIADNPGQYIGEKLVQGAAGAATAPIGGEAAAGLRGLIGDLNHGIPDTPGHHSGGGGGGFGGDHSVGVGDHGGGPGGHGIPGGNPAPFDFDNPLQTARPEFNIPNPLEVMSPELRHLVDQNLTGSGETVIGPYAPKGGGPSYIDVAQQRGASYFDIGDAWNRSTATQQLASNQYALDMAVKNGDTIRMSVPFYRIDPSSFTGAEIRYFESHGYQRLGDNTLIPPGGTP